jgi:hypothetical protein
VIDFHHFFIASFLSKPIRSTEIGGLRARQAKLPTKFSTDHVDGWTTAVAAPVGAGTPSLAVPPGRAVESLRVSNIFIAGQRFRGIGARLLKP